MKFHTSVRWLKFIESELFLFNKMTERHAAQADALRERHPQIFNLQFPDKSGFTLRYNPGSGIFAALRPAMLGRVGI
jgi:hypothetical protein